MPVEGDVGSDVFSQGVFPASPDLPASRPQNSRKVLADVVDFHLRRLCVNMSRRWG